MFEHSQHPKRSPLPSLVLVISVALSFAGCRSQPTNEFRFAAAAFVGDLSTVKSFVNDRAVDINSQNRPLGPALIAASLGGHTEIVTFLVASGADTNIREEGGGTALTTASYRGYVEIATVLLENGADANIRFGERGPTPLVFAAVGGHPKMIRVLLDHGADPNLELGPDEDGNSLTALTLARTKNDPECVRLLEKASRH